MGVEPDDEGVPPIPFLADIAKALAGQGPVSWDVARQVAMMGATGGRETNVEPLARTAIERLADVARRRVDESFVGRIAPPGESGANEVRIEVVNRSTWVHRTMKDYEPIFLALATALSTTHTEPDDDPMAAMLASLGTMIAPALSGMAVGSMLGQLAARVFGLYDLPIPRVDREPLMIVAVNVDAFAEQWSIEADEMRMWVLVHELVSHVVVGSPGIHRALTRSMTDFVAAFRPDPSSLGERLAGIELDGSDPTEMLSKMFSDPTVLLGAVRSPEQERLAPAVDSVVAVTTGLVDRAVDETVAAVLGTSSRASEAVRRLGIEASAEDRFVEGLLGLRLTRDLVQTGRSFVDGVVERAGYDSLAPLLHDARNVPTPNELAAPGLWLARIETQDA